MCYKSVELQYCHESRLWHLHIAYLPHAFLALFLLLQQLALTGDVTSVALGQHVLAHGLYGLAGNDLGSDGGLYRYLELLSGNQFLELLADTAAEGIREDRASTDSPLSRISSLTRSAF